MTQDARLRALALADRTSPGVWSRPGGRWWLQGLEPVGTTEEGLARLPGRARLIWYWPSVVVAAADLLVLIACARSLAAEIRARHERRGDTRYKISTSALPDGRVPEDPGGDT